MTALRFQTGEGHQTSLASLRGGRERCFNLLWKRERERHTHTHTHTDWGEERRGRGVRGENWGPGGERWEEREMGEGERERGREREREREMRR